MLNSDQPQALNTARLTHTHPKTTHNVARTFQNRAYVPLCSATLSYPPIPSLVPSAIVPEDGFWCSIRPHVTPPDNASRKCDSSAAHLIPSLAAVLPPVLHTRALAFAVSSPTIPGTQHIHSRCAKPMDALQHPLQHTLFSSHIHLVATCQTRIGNFTSTVPTISRITTGRRRGN